MTIKTALHEVEALLDDQANLSTEQLVRVTRVYEDLRMEQAKTEARDGPTCPGCSGRGKGSSLYPGILFCEDCHGVYTIRTLGRDEALRLVGLNRPMQANCPPEYMKYFNLEIEDGTDGVRRVHGWTDSRTGCVVQYG